MHRLVRWLHPRWGQMLCFWGAVALAAPALSDRALLAVSHLTNFDALFDTASALTVSGALLVAGLVLKLYALLERRAAQ